MFVVAVVLAMAISAAPPQAPNWFERALLSQAYPMSKTARQQDFDGNEALRRSQWLLKRWNGESAAKLEALLTAAMQKAPLTDARYLLAKLHVERSRMDKALATLESMALAKCPLCERWLLRAWDELKTLRTVPRFQTLIAPLEVNRRISKTVVRAAIESLRRYRTGIPKALTAALKERIPLHVTSDCFSLSRDFRQVSGLLRDTASQSAFFKELSREAGPVERTARPRNIRCKHRCCTVAYPRLEPDGGPLPTRVCFHPAADKKLVISDVEYTHCPQIEWHFTPPAAF